MNIFVTYLMGFDQEERDHLAKYALKTDICYHETPDRRIINSDPYGNIVKVVINSAWCVDFEKIYTELFCTLRNPMRVSIYTMNKHGEICDHVCFNDLKIGLRKLDDDVILNKFHVFRGSYACGRPSGWLIDKIERGGI
jgi:hypothetical protein